MGGVVDEYVDSAQLGHGHLDNASAVVRMLYIAGDKYSLLARILHKLLGLLGVVVLIQIGNDYVGALARICDGDRASDSAVRARDNRLLAVQATRPAVGLFAVIGQRLHQVRFAGHWLGLLWKRRLRGLIHGWRPCANVVREIPSRDVNERAQSKFLAPLRRRWYGTWFASNPPRHGSTFGRQSSGFCNGPRRVNPSCIIHSPGTCFCTGSAQGRHLMGCVKDRSANLRMRGRVPTS